MVSSEGAMALTIFFPFSPLAPWCLARKCDKKEELWWAKKLEKGGEAPWHQQKTHDFFVGDIAPKRKRCRSEEFQAKAGPKYLSA